MPSKSTNSHSFLDQLLARLPYTHKLIDDITALNPKYDSFQELTKRKEERLTQQSVVAPESPQEMDVGKGAIMINKDYHQYMYSNIDVDKIRRLQQYRRMAAYAEVSDAIDEICDETIVKDQEDNIVKVDIKGSYKDSIKKELKKEWKKFITIFKLEDRGWEYFRQFLIDGELFFENVISQNRPDFGILGVVSIPSELINPVHDNVQNGLIKGFLLRRAAPEGKQNATTNEKEELIIFDKNQITYVHSGLWNEDRTMRIPYIENARRAYKQLSLIEDSIIIYRLVRAPERLVFYVDVGNMPAPKAEQYLQKLIRQYWSRKTYDASGKSVQNVYDPQSMLDSFWFAKKNGQEGTKVEQLQGGCLAMDTQIPLLDGRTLTLSEMTEEYKSGKQNWIYSCDPKTGRIVPGKVDWAGVTQESAKVVKLTFDNGNSLVCTLDHKFPTITRGKLRADELNVGDSIYSLERKNMKLKRVKNPYEHVYQHDIKKWEPTHRIVAKYLRDTDYINNFIYNDNYIDNNGKTVFNTIHHVDVDRYNNTPENLVWMNFNDHYLMHGETSSPEMNKKISNGIKNYISNLTDEEREIRAEISRKNWKLGNKKYKELLKNPIYFAKISKNKSLALIKALKDPKKRQIKSEINRERWKNNQEYRDIMINSNKNRWLNKDFREKTINNMSLIYSEESLRKLIDVINETKIVEQKALVEYLNKNTDNAFSRQFMLENGNKKGWKHEFTKNLMKNFIRSHGYKNYAQFRREFEFFNHRVTNIEYLDKEIQVGTLTIDKNEELHDYHTFATSCGVMTYNSNLGQLDDLMYFVKKLYKSLKVPIGRLNPDDTFKDGTEVTREELRFAKFVMRLQRQFAMALKDAFIVHLKLRKLWEQYKLKEHEISLTFNTPTQFMLMREQQAFNMKVENYTNMGNNELVAQSYAQRHYLDWTDDMMAENREWLRKDNELMWEIEQIRTNGPDFREKQNELEAAVGDIQGAMGGGAAVGAAQSELGKFTPDTPPEFGPSPAQPGTKPGGESPEATRAPTGPQ